MIAIDMNTCSAAGGTWKFLPILRSSVLACFVKKVEDCTKRTPYIRHVAQIGNNRRRLFASSAEGSVLSSSGSLCGMRGN